MPYHRFQEQDTQTLSFGYAIPDFQPVVFKDKDHVIPPLKSMRSRRPREQLRSNTGDRRIHRRRRLLLQRDDSSTHVRLRPRRPEGLPAQGLPPWTRALLACTVREEKKGESCGLAARHQRTVPHDNTQGKRHNHDVHRVQDALDRPVLDDRRSLSRCELRRACYTCIVATAIGVVLRGCESGRMPKISCKLPQQQTVRHRIARAGHSTVTGESNNR